jgi:hypothetical protein
MKNPSVRNRRSWIKPGAIFVFIHNRVFGTDSFYPYQKHGWRAQRASALAAFDSIDDAV